MIESEEKKNCCSWGMMWSHGWGYKIAGVIIHYAEVSTPVKMKRSLFKGEKKEKAVAKSFKS